MLKTIDYHLDTWLTPGPEHQRPLWQDMGMAAAWVLATALVVYVLKAAGFPSPESLSIAFVIPILCASILLDLRVTILSVILSEVAYSLILPPAVLDLGLTATAKLLILLVAALITRLVAGRVRRLIKESRRRGDVLAAVHALTQDMLGITTVADMRTAASAKIAELTELDCEILLAAEISEEDKAAAQALTGQIVMSGEDSICLALPGQTSPLGIIRLAGSVRDIGFDALTTIASQTAAALETAARSEAHALQRLSAERQKFSSALLSSISHDFKTPLVTIIGALSTVIDSRVSEHVHELAEGGLFEARKLNHFITNLLEISRLDAGLPAMSSGPILIHDVFASALRSLRPLIVNQIVRIEVSSDFPLINVNPALLELVVQNLVDNALKYGRTDGQIVLRALQDSHSVVIHVDDDGDGIPSEFRDRVFDRFFRSDTGDRRTAGTGLGLYICREIVTAYGGVITALTHPDGDGTRMCVSLPSALAVALPALAED